MISRSEGLAIIFYIISAFFIGLGFHKIFFYKNWDSAVLQDKNINAYVGGDAYNYIINSNYATGFFVLALLFTVLGSTVLILDRINENKEINNTKQLNDSASNIIEEQEEHQEKDNMEKVN